MQDAEGAAMLTEGVTWWGLDCMQWAAHAAPASACLVLSAPTCSALIQALSMSCAALFPAPRAR